LVAKPGSPRMCVVLTAVGPSLGAPWAWAGLGALTPLFVKYDNRCQECPVTLLGMNLAYSPEVVDILAMDGNGERLMPLAMKECSSEAARERLRTASAARLFAGARAPEAALSGLYVYFSCFEEAHSIAQDIATPEGSYWHGIVHRQEPDAGNAAYWFRQVGPHPIFPALARATGQEGPWDPFAFIEMCEQARRQPGSELETRAREIQRIEWQLLFDYCARPAAP
jgi:hypothetical protein